MIDLEQTVYVHKDIITLLETGETCPERGTKLALYKFEGTVPGKVIDKITYETHTRYLVEFTNFKAVLQDSGWPHEAITKYVSQNRASDWYSERDLKRS